MTKQLTITIECGENTCASSPGRFCLYIQAEATGHNPSCYLFGKQLRDENGGMLGWLQRCKECKEAEK